MDETTKCGTIPNSIGTSYWEYTYDGRGNLISNDKYTRTTSGMAWQNEESFVYDETGRMVQGKNEQGEVSLYTYNGLGIRVGRELIMKDNTHGYTDFHKEPPSVSTDIDKPEVVKESYVIDYTSATFNTLVMEEEGGFNYRWVYGLSKLSVKITSEGTNWWGQNVTTDILKDYLHQDRLGSTTNLSDQFGRVVGRADYNEWGEVTFKESLSITSSYRRIWPQLSYTGHDWDDVLGMYYAKARFYDADAKRFVAINPIKGQITDPLSLVSYLYCVDNPLRWVDPLGYYYTYKSDDGDYYVEADSEAAQIALFLIGKIPYVGTGLEYMIGSASTGDAIGGTSYKHPVRSFVEGYLLEEGKGKIKAEAINQAVKILGPAIGKESVEAIGKDIFWFWDILKLEGDIQERREVPVMDSITFTLFNMIGYEMRAKTQGEIEEMMSLAEKYVSELAFLFLMPAYGTWSRNVWGTPQFAAGPSMFSILLSKEENRKAKEMGETSQTRTYSSQFGCIKNWNNPYLQEMFVWETLAEFGPVNPRTDKRIISVYDYMMENDSIIDDILRSFKSYVDSGMKKYRKENSLDILPSTDNPSFSGGGSGSTSNIDSKNNLRHELCLVAF